MTRDLTVAGVGLGRGGVEDNAYIFKLRLSDQIVDPSSQSGNAHAAGARQTIGTGIESNQRSHFQSLGGSEHLDHQVCADVSRTKDGNFGLHIVSMYLFQ
jgi:hypothetical protein